MDLFGLTNSFARTANDTNVANFPLFPQRGRQNRTRVGRHAIVTVRCEKSYVPQ